MTFSEDVTATDDIVQTTSYDRTLFSKDISKQAFSHPMGAMDDAMLDVFVTGRSFFTIPWVEAPSATTARDGLGPLFSANTCINCHPGHGAGVAIDDEGTLRRDLVMRLALSSQNDLDEMSMMSRGSEPEPTYGAQFSINGTHGTSYEGHVEVEYEEKEGSYPDGSSYSLRMSHYTLERLGYGPLHENTAISPRIALALVGLGMLEQIPEEAILAHEDIDDRDGDGISGKANWVYTTESSERQLGRFTWKASSPTVRYQSANAANNDMGLTSPLFPKENCTEAQKACKDADKGHHTFDLPGDRLDAITFYITHLKIPSARDFSDKEEAETLFSTLRCDSCHVSTYTTAMGVEIAPFSDLLLHDMGEGLADGHRDFLASGSEWRTPPLWGIGLYKDVSTEANYLHDGRARSIEEAILWHGGEAEGAKRAFMALGKKKRELLIDYLGTI